MASAADLPAALQDILYRLADATGFSVDTVAVTAAVVLVTLLLWVIGLPPFSRASRVEPPPIPKPRPQPLQLGELTLEQLKGYDGRDPTKPILVAIRGKVYDVSRGRHLYGPEGGYSCFAGKDASRALAKMSMDASDATGDLTGLSNSELDTLQEWEAQYKFKYDIVGTLAGGTGSARLDKAGEAS